YAPGLVQTTLHYSYSAIGNLTCLDGTAPTDCPGGRTLTYPTGGANVARPHAPTTVNGNIVGYTASGNLQTLGNRRYTYDALDRLTQVQEASQTLARFTYTSSGERIKSVDTSGPRSVTQYLLSDDFDFDATRKLARIHLALGSATVATLTQPYAPTPTKAALAPAGPAPFPAGPAVASALLLLALLGLGLALTQRQRRGQPLMRPALASGLVLVLWIASVPSSVWALPLDGDLNGDRKLDGADALLALQIVQGRAPSSSELQSGDVAPLGAAPTTPSAINAADALLILRGAQGDDVDGDGLGSQAEVTFGSSPFKADTDGDGMSDLAEFLIGTDPRNAGADGDGDGLSDAAEMAAGTDPFDRDTDGDGLPDNTDPQPLQGASFLHGDQLGSTILVTGANATVIQRVAYRPYGATVAPSTGPTTTPRFGFNGQRFESAIGVYDYNARFYDPTLGRFLQPDSIVPEPTDPQSLNRYSYVRNSPVNRIDPTGNVDFGGFFRGVGNFFRGAGTAVGSFFKDAFSGGGPQDRFFESLFFEPLRRPAKFVNNNGNLEVTVFGRQSFVDGLQGGADSLTFWLLGSIVGAEAALVTGLFAGGIRVARGIANDDPVGVGLGTLAALPFVGRALPLGSGGGQFVDSDILVKAFQGSAAALSALRRTTSFVTPNGLREFLAGGAGRAAFLEREGVQLFGGPEAGAVANSAVFQETFQKIAAAQGRADAALAAFAKATGIPAITFERRLVNFITQTLRDSSIPISRVPR
ncbi:MAG TPA: RHS repeat-associated core domain-containing protein, partial [Polyangiaceae bacterium]|nr:RHS repeat-associated core domain-containing protein [Polyangiaceae bacterium]